MMSMGIVCQKCSRQPVKPPTHYYFKQFRKLSVYAIFVPKLTIELETDSKIGLLIRTEFFGTVPEQISLLFQQLTLAKAMHVIRNNPALSLTCFMFTALVDSISDSDRWSADQCLGMTSLQAWSSLRTFATFWENSAYSVLVFKLEFSLNSSSSSKKGIKLNLI